MSRSTTSFSLVTTTSNKLQKTTTTRRRRTTLDSSTTDEDEDDVKEILIAPIASLDGVVTLPGSKSLSNRCLLLAALSTEGPTKVSNLLDSDDIRYMLSAFETLQIQVDKINDDTVVVHGVGGPIPVPASDSGTIDLFLGNAGTAMRPLAAALCYSPAADADAKNNFVLDGVPRMRERPIADLIDGLQQLGATVDCIEETGCPPVTIRPQQSISGGKTASISGKMSSQFLSSMLMAAPLASGSDDVVIDIKDELISAPYVALTIGLMKQFGVEVEISDSRSKSTTIESTGDGELSINAALEMALPRPRFTIKGSSQYTSPKEILVEGDASSASYFLAGAAITKGKITVRGCGRESVQGDVEFALVLEMMGAKVEWTADSITVNGLRDGITKLQGVDVDCGKIPDAAMTLAVVALFAEGPTTIRNVYSWRLKETERMKAIVAECTKLGATVEEFRDYCIITPPKDGVLNNNVEIETYDDHRMAMTFSLAACGNVNVIIRDPDCTAKTFPTYFTTLESIAKR